jgi:enoyl-CoA hydratase/carnithine racemase
LLYPEKEVFIIIIYLGAGVAFCAGNDISLDKRGLISGRRGSKK